MANPGTMIRAPGKPGDRLQIDRKLGSSSLSRAKDLKRHSWREGFMELKTDESLLQALHKAAERKQSPDDLHRQRVSYIFGSIKESSGVTRSRIEDVLAQQEGR